MLPGSIGPQPDDLMAVAEDKYLLRWKEQWIPTTPPSRVDRFQTGDAGFGSWSRSGNKFVCPFRRDIGTSDLDIYFFDRAISQGWEGRYSHEPLQAKALAVRFAEPALQVIAGLFQGGMPDRMIRVAYDRVILQENVKSGQTTGTAKISAVPLPEGWPLRTDAVQAAFLGREGRWVAVAGSGQVVRWDLSNPDRLEPSLTLAQIAAQGIPSEQARVARLSLVTGPPDSPVYATCWLPGKVLVWLIPVQGPAAFIGNAQAVGPGEVAQLAARPDGQAWAVVMRGAEAAPGTAESSPLKASSATLYLTGPGFAAPQVVDLQSRTPRDPAWSPTGGVLYFVLDDTEIWKVPPGQPPQRLAVGPPRASLQQTPEK
jgi:hypothetical protein